MGIVWIAGLAAFITCHTPKALSLLIIYAMQVPGDRTSPLTEQKPKGNLLTW